MYTYCSYQEAAGRIGNTPLQRIIHIGTNGLELFAKLEFENAFGSIKDRVALEMIEDAEKKGILMPYHTIVEPSSGNTAIALANIGRLKGYKVKIIVLANIPEKKKQLIKEAGAVLELIEPEDDECCPLFPNEGAIGVARAYAESPKYKGQYIMLNQYQNPANPVAQRRTAEEIWRQMNGNIDIVIVPVGTGGTMAGMLRLKELNPNLKIVPVDSESKYFGMKSYKDALNFKIPRDFDAHVQRDPQNFFFHTLKSEDDGFIGAMELAEKEGILAGLTGGALFYVAKQFAEQGHKGRAVFIVPDGSDRYQQEIKSFKRRMNLEERVIV